MKTKQKNIKEITQFCNLHAFAWKETKENKGMNMCSKCKETKPVQAKKKEKLFLIKFSEYIDFIKRLDQEKPIPLVGDVPQIIMDAVMDYCDKNIEVGIDFIRCHFNPLALYALYKYRIKYKKYEANYDELIKYLQKKI